MKKIGLKKLRRKDPKGRYAKFEEEDGRQLSEDESDEEEEDIETGGQVRRGGKLATSAVEEENELDDIDLEHGGVQTTTDGQNVSGIELANRARVKVKEGGDGGRRLSEIEGDIELREIEDNDHKSHSSTCTGTHKDCHVTDSTKGTTSRRTSNPPEIKDDRGDTGINADAEKKTDSTDKWETGNASGERKNPEEKEEVPLGPDEVLLKLQITGLEQEIRRNVRINKNSTIKHLKETQFSKEIDEGYNVRVFHSGQMRQDSFGVERLSNEFVHCFLSKLVKPAPSSRGSTVDEENPSTLGDIAHISIWPTLLGISSSANGSRIEWMAHAPNQGQMAADIANEFSDCALGIHDSVVEWPTFTGLLCGFCFFPWGMIICLLHRQTRCRRCGAMG